MRDLATKRERESELWRECEKDGARERDKERQIMRGDEKDIYI